MDRFRQPLPRLKDVSLVPNNAPPVIVKILECGYSVQRGDGVKLVRLAVFPDSMGKFPPLILCTERSPNPFFWFLGYSFYACGIHFAIVYDYFINFNP